MTIDRARLIYFSPTRTTKKILEGISEGLHLKIAETIDLTTPGEKMNTPDEILENLVLIGSPVYSGRIPPLAAQRIRRFKGRHTPAVLVVVYGNRGFDDALLELRDIAMESGFKPIAGAAFIGEHSLADASRPIALGRPDVSDLDKARLFGEKIEKKMTTISSFDTIPALQVPGNHPYRERTQRQPISPLTREDVCTKCGQCATVCPTGTVTVGDTVTTDPAACIICFACVKDCPSGARHLEDAGIEKAAKRLSETCSGRKEPEIFGV